MNLKAKVVETLRDHPKTRNSDPQLTFMVIYKFHNSHIKKFEGKWWTTTEIQKKIREDSVKRIRAKLNSEGKFLPTDEKILRQRRLLEKQWREEYSPSNPARG